MYKKALGITLSFLFCATITMAQNVVVRGEFHKDSIKIGMPIPYSLTAKYPKNYNLIFPDSLYDFSPFEYESRVYYTTQSDSANSLDSVVYFLSTFEIDTVQKLSLPVYQINNKDTTSFASLTDSVFLIHLIEEIPDSVQLKENTSHLNVPTQFNYPYFLIGSVTLIILITILLLIFGKRMRNSWKLYQLNKRFKKYIIKHDIAVDSVRSQITTEGANKIVQLWKTYLEKLEKRPFTKLTTKEIHTLFDTEQEVIEVLKEVDRLIYGGMEIKNVDFERLKAFASKRNERRKEEVKNG